MLTGTHLDRAVRTAMPVFAGIRSKVFDFFCICVAAPVDTGLPHLPTPTTPERRVVGTWLRLSMYNKSNPGPALCMMGRGRGQRPRRFNSDAGTDIKNQEPRIKDQDHCRQSVATREAQAGAQLTSTHTPLNMNVVVSIHTNQYRTLPVAIRERAGTAVDTGQASAEQPVLSSSADRTVNGVTDHGIARRVQMHHASRVARVSAISASPNTGTSFCFSRAGLWGPLCTRLLEA